MLQRSPVESCRGTGPLLPSAAFLLPPSLFFFLNFPLFITSLFLSPSVLSPLYPFLFSISCPSPAVPLSLSHSLSLCVSLSLSLSFSLSLSLSLSLALSLSELSPIHPLLHLSFVICTAQQHGVKTSLDKPTSAINANCFTLKLQTSPTPDPYFSVHEYENMDLEGLQNRKVGPTMTKNTDRMCRRSLLYSLVQWNWFSDVTHPCNSGSSSDPRGPIALHQAVKNPLEKSVFKPYNTGSPSQITALYCSYFQMSAHRGFAQFLYRLLITSC